MISNEAMTNPVMLSDAPNKRTAFRNRLSQMESLTLQIAALEEEIKYFWTTEAGKHALAMINDNSSGCALATLLFDRDGRLVDYNMHWTTLMQLHQDCPRAAEAFEFTWRLLDNFGGVLEVLYGLRCQRRQLLDSSVECEPHVA